MLAGWAERVTVTGDAAVGDMQAVGRIVLTDGQTIPFAHDLAAPIPAPVLQRSLRAKGAGLIGGRAEPLWDAVAGLDALTARDIGALLRA